MCAVAGEYRPAEMDAVESFFCWSMFVFRRSEAGATTDRAAMERKQPDRRSSHDRRWKGPFPRRTLVLSPPRVYLFAPSCLLV